MKCVDCRKKGEFIIYDVSLCEKCARKRSDKYEKEDSKFKKAMLGLCGFLIALFIFTITIGYLL